MNKPRGYFFPLRPGSRKSGRLRLSSKLRSIQLIITLTFMAVTAAVAVIVSIMLYGKFANTAEENANLNMQQIIEQVNYNLELYVKGMGSILRPPRSRLPLRPPSIPRCSMNGWIP